MKSLILVFTAMTMCLAVFGQAAQADSVYERSRKFWFNNVDSSRFYLTLSLKLAREAKYLKGEANALKGLGLFSKSNAERLQYYLSALEIRQQLNDSLGIGISLADIGTIYLELGDETKMTEYLNRSLSVRKKIRDYGGIAYTLIVFGHNEESKHNFSRALSIYKESLIYRQKAGEVNGIAFSHINMANAFLNLQQYDSSLYFAQLARTEFAKANNTFSTEWVQWIVATCFFKTGFADKALDEISKINVSKDGENSLRVLQLLADIYESRSDFRRGFYYQKQWIEKNRKIQAESNEEKARKLAADFEYKLKVEETARQEEAAKAKKRRQDNLQFLLIAIGLIGVFIAIISIRKKVSLKAMEVVSFVGFLLLFEFLVVLIDPALQSVSNNKPIFLFLTNAALALLIARLHRVLENFFKARILRTPVIE